MSCDLSISAVQPFDGYCAGSIEETLTVEIVCTVLVVGIWCLILSYDNVRMFEIAQLEHLRKHITATGLLSGLCLGSAAVGIN